MLYFKPVKPKFMLKKKYQKQIKEILLKHLGQNIKAIIFGSSVQDEQFHDIDIAVLGGNECKFSKIREELENSHIPYKVDLINLDQVEEKFKNKILKQKIIWLI